MLLACAGAAPTVLPDGWTLKPPGVLARTGTMPQGFALSPSGSMLAVVESGFNPAALSLYRVPRLSRIATVALPGAYGRPVWADSRHVVVAGANDDAVLVIDVRGKGVRRIRLPKGTNPVYLARAANGLYAVASAGDAAVRIGRLDELGRARPIPIGGLPGGLAFGAGGSTLFAAGISNNALLAIDARSGRVIARTAAMIHPCSILTTAAKVYVSECDSDRVAVYAPRGLRLITRIAVGNDTRTHLLGVSPNALFAQNDLIFVSLAAANSVAVIRDDRVVGRMPAGWYPTDVAALGEDLYVLNGKGEGAHPNPDFRYPQGSRGYVAALEYGSLRRYALPSTFAMEGNAQGSSSWNVDETSSVLRAHGPIRHVFFVLKENRSYDQILGDVRAGNGDPHLAWFGGKVTPNEHALAARFGLYDNAYVNGEVSAAGHMWADSAFADDFLQRSWPGYYAQRFDLDDLKGGGDASTPATGYIWQAARRAHVSFRDYGELMDPGKTPRAPWIPDVPSLRGYCDPNYAGFDLDYSDVDRAREWEREFQRFVSAGTLPQFEFIWLPNDHTYASRPGKLTPDAYVAQNDYALGRIVQAVSHSRVWGSSAIFVMEDDAQDGPDHVSDQRTTLFVVSPYARAGVHHDHYTTVSVLRTIEMLLGIRPLSTYDAMALPMYDSFTAHADTRAYTELAPQIDITRRNQKTAYGAQESARLDFSRADAIAPATLGRILAHNH